MTSQASEGKPSVCAVVPSSILHAAAVQDTSLWQKDVWLCKARNKKLFAVATDSYVLAICPCDQAEHVFPEDEKVLVPREVFKTKNNGLVLVRQFGDKFVGSGFNVKAPETVTAQAVTDKKCPPFEDILPSLEDHKVSVKFDVKLLLKLSKAVSSDGALTLCINPASSPDRVASIIVIGDKGQGLLAAMANHDLGERSFDYTSMRNAMTSKVLGDSATKDGATASKPVRKQSSK